MIGDRNGFIPAVDVVRALKLSVAQRDPYVLEDIATAMKDLGFDKKTIHVPKEWRKPHENEKQWCYVRGDGEKSKKRIILGGGDDFDLVRLCLTGNSGGKQKRD
jgi:signal recognition particle subunit SEC65